MTKNKSHGNGLAERDPKTGQFLVGHSRCGGRQIGSRNKLTTEFLDDLYAKWRKHGAEVLDRVIRDDPAQFLKTVAAVLPKQLDETLNLNVSLFAEARDLNEAYKLAVEYMNRKVIEADDAAIDD